MFSTQNKEYVNTSDMVKYIAEVHGRRIRMTTAQSGYPPPDLQETTHFPRCLVLWYMTRACQSTNLTIQYVADQRRFYRTDRGLTGIVMAYWLSYDMYVNRKYLCDERT